MDGGVAAGRLLSLPVRLNGIPLGRPLDLVLDLESRRAVGLEVLCGDEAVRYLPLAAARVHEHEIAIRSALVLFEERDLAWFRRRARTLRDLRGAPVSLGSRALGPLADVEVGQDGTLALLVEEDGHRRRLAFDQGVTISVRGSASAA